MSKVLKVEDGIFLASPGPGVVKEIEGMIADAINMAEAEGHSVSFILNGILVTVDKQSKVRRTFLNWRRAQAMRD